MSIRQPVESLLLSNSLRPAAAGLLKGLAAELAVSGITVNVVGRKALDHFKRRNVPILKISLNLGSADFPIAAAIAGDAVQNFLEEKADRVFMVYNEFKSAAANRESPSSHQLPCPCQSQPDSVRAAPEKANDAL